MLTVLDPRRTEEKADNEKHELEWDYSLIKNGDGYSLVVKQFPYIGVLEVRNIRSRTEAIQMAIEYCQGRNVRLFIDHLSVTTPVSHIKTKRYFTV